MRRAVSIAVGFGLASSMALANPPVEQQIQQIDKALDAEPDVSLILQRGTLHRSEGRYDAALADYELAGTFVPNHPRLPMLRGEALLLAGRYDEAVAALGVALERDKRDAQAWALRAEAFSKLANLKESETHWDTAISLALANSGPQLPDWILSRSHVQEAQGAEALASAVADLDLAMTSLGPLIVLELRAVELEVLKGDIEAAVERLDVIIARMNRPERYLVQKADLLMGAGRFSAASAAYSLALTHLEMTQTKRSLTSAGQNLQERAAAGFQAAELARHAVSTQSEQ